VGEIIPEWWAKSSGISTRMTPILVNIAGPPFSAASVTQREAVEIELRLCVIPSVID
jgi:hypothetical protein